MMYCPHCGEFYEDGAFYCAACTKPLRADTPVSPVLSAAQEGMMDWWSISSWVVCSWVGMFFCAGVPGDLDNWRPMSFRMLPATVVALAAGIIALLCLRKHLTDPWYAVKLREHAIKQIRWAIRAGIYLIIAYILVGFALTHLPSRWFSFSTYTELLPFYPFFVVGLLAQLLGVIRYNRICAISLFCSTLFVSLFTVITEAGFPCKIATAVCLMLFWLGTAGTFQYHHAEQLLAKCSTQVPVIE